MRFLFRTKLILLVTMAVVTIGSLLALSYGLGVQRRIEIEKLENRLVPRIELALTLDAEFAELKRAFQDAVQAQEIESLDDAATIKEEIDRLITAAGPALDVAIALNLRLRLHDYYDSATAVSTMLIRNESGATALEAMSSMQRKQREAEAAVISVTRVDRSELKRSFGALKLASKKANQIRLTVGLCGLLLLLSFGFLATRHMIRVLASVSGGLSKFSTGDFSTAIEITTNDELGDLARDANQMAASLLELADQRDREDWIRAGQVELAVELSGNVNLETLADRVAAYLAQRTHALAVAVYLEDEDRSLRVIGQCGCASAPLGPAAATTPSGARPVIARGEGLVGAALSTRQLTVHSDLPPHYFPIVSGLGQASAGHVVLLPLAREDEILGVIELAYCGVLSGRVQQFLGSVRDSLHTSLDAARGRATVDRLLTETRAQAELLGQQEEELRLSNQELFSQQEELRRANEGLIEQQKALSERNEELDTARTRIEEKVAEISRVSLYKSQFLANMSHELRTPLNSMLLLSHLLAENEAKTLNAKQVQHCLTIHSAGEDLLALINQVLDLAKIEAGKQDVHLEEVSIEGVVANMRRMFEPLADEKQLTFSVNESESCPSSLITDRSRLERILINLLSNAIKFTERGEVSLAIEASDVPTDHGLEAIVFIVTDTGIGIDPAEQERAFIPFEQIESSSSRRFQGTGLGLTIVRESAQLLGGEIFLHSEPGKGSTFRCVLPVVSPTRATPSEVVADFEASIPSAEPVQILIIEDDPILGEQLLEIVRARHLSAALVRTGNEGLALAKRSKPCGIVLDVKLPDTDGWTVMERLQNDAATKDIPVHFLSALDAPQNGLMRGAVGYLTKPATRKELSELIQTLVPTNPATSRKILVVEDDATEGQSIVALLESEHFQAVHVPSAEDALTAMKAHPFGCIILDLGLRTMDGVGLLNALRQRPDFFQLSIIIHTGRSLTREEANLLRSHSQAIVLKDGSSAQRLLEEVRLFVHHVTKHGAATSALPTKAQVSDSRNLRGLRVLLVEDDMRTVYSLSALLQSRGCEVLVAENGREALDVLKQRRDVQIMVTDIMMPEMDGYETMTQVRKMPAWEGLPIIALTARATGGERERCLAAGADVYLSKPVDADQLISALSTFAGGNDDQ